MPMGITMQDIVHRLPDKQGQRGFRRDVELPGSAEQGVHDARYRCGKLYKEMNERWRVA